MATTLFDLVLRIGEFVTQDFVTSAATSGSSLTSIIDQVDDDRDYVMYVTRQISNGEG